MGLDSNTKVLQKVPLFQGLTPEQLSIIAFTASWRSFMPGETILEKGQPASSAFVILTGQAITPSRDPEAEPERLGPGTLLGEPAMFYETTYRSTVIAERGVGTIAITIETLRKILQRDPSIGRYLVDSIRVRLQAMSQTLAGLEQALASEGIASESSNTSGS